MEDWENKPRNKRKRPRLAWQIPNGPGDLLLCRGRLAGAGSRIGGKGKPKDSHLLVSDLGQEAACFPLVRMGGGSRGRTGC